MATDKEPSEFGGEPGLIQNGAAYGFAHELTAAEQARLMRATNDADEVDTPEGALIREWERERRL